MILIDLDALGDNWRSLRDVVAPARCSAVVKANAYGLGADRVIPTLAQTGCDTFFVATLKEAHEARALAPKATIFILDGVLPGSAPLIAQSGAWPVISSLDEAREWAASTPATGANGTRPCAIQLDTGLNRLGFDETALLALAEDHALMSKLDVKLVMSHMACADEPGHPMNEQQRNAFDRLRDTAPTAPLSLAASDGLMLGKPFHYDLVRPGYALYGGQAFQGSRTPVSPVISAYARVLSVRTCTPGDTVGYSASYCLDRPSKVATVALGYADGLPRNLSTQSPTTSSTTLNPRVAFANQFAPIIGRVSMDLITVDVTHIEGPPIGRGDWAEIIGPNITIEEHGTAAGTIGYEILTRLGARCHRTYLDPEHTPQKPAAR